MTNMYVEDKEEVPTWNPLIGGGTNDGPVKPCRHDCSYCYVSDIIGNNPVLRELYSGPIRLNSNAFKKDPKDAKRRKKAQKDKDIMIFVGNMHDVFAESIPSDIIMKILEHCRKYPNNKYLFQTKNPGRFLEFWGLFPPRSVFATTLETDNWGILKDHTNAPSIRARSIGMIEVSKRIDEIKKESSEIMVTMEPVFDFNPEMLAGEILSIYPDKVYIGADSKLLCRNCGYGGGAREDFRWRGKKRCSKCGSKDITNAHGYPEPTKEKIESLIGLLGEFTKVRIKSNLYRILEE